MTPKFVELDVEQLEAKLVEVERVLGEETARPFRMLLGAYVSLLGMIQAGKLTIRRLQQMLFGARTERTRNVVSSANSESAGGDSD